MNEKNLAEALWAAVVVAVRAEIAKAEAAKVAAAIADELWNAELSKSAEEAVHDNMYPQRWA